MQVRLRLDRHTGAPAAAAPACTIAASLQNLQIDNQLSSATFPVVLCRRNVDDGSTVARDAPRRGGHLLKAAQRAWEAQAQGPPLLQLHVERLLQPTTDCSDGNVFLKCASPQTADWVLRACRNKKCSSGSE